MKEKGVNLHNRLTDTETDLWLPSGRRVGEGRMGVQDSRCTLLYTGWINNKVLLQSTGNCIQYPDTSHSGKEYANECVYIYA